MRMRVEVAGRQFYPKMYWWGWSWSTKCGVAAEGDRFTPIPLGSPDLEQKNDFFIEANKMWWKKYPLRRDWQLERKARGAKLPRLEVMEAEVEVLREREAELSSEEKKALDGIE